MSSEASLMSTTLWPGKNSARNFWCSSHRFSLQSTHLTEASILLGGSETSHRSMSVELAVIFWRAFLTSSNRAAWMSKKGFSWTPRYRSGALKSCSHTGHLQGLGTEDEDEDEDEDDEDDEEET